MKIKTRIAINEKTISTSIGEFPEVENCDEFELYAPQKGRAVEDVLKRVFEQKISPQNLKQDSVVVAYTVAKKYVKYYKVSMGMVALNAEEI